MRVLLAILLTASTAHGQWLPEADQTRDRSLWDATGVAFPAGMQFYKVRRVSQRLVIVTNARLGMFSQMSNGIYADDYVNMLDGKEMPNPHKKPMWSAPGGLAHVSRDEWRNATAVYLPSEVKIYSERTNVKNSSGSYQSNSVLRWTFPDETVFADVLIAKRDGKEYVFEIRCRHKVDGEWHSTAYRPYANENELPLGSRKHKYLGSIHDAVSNKPFDAWLIPDGPLPSPFKASTLAVGGGAFPKNYVGNVAACATCHSRAAEAGDYAGLAAPGGDQALGWHPWLLTTLNTDFHPIADKRWGIKVLDGSVQVK